MNNFAQTVNPQSAVDTLSNNILGALSVILLFALGWLLTKYVKMIDERRQDSLANLDTMKDIKNVIEMQNTNNLSLHDKLDRVLRRRK
jgi:p-aminobenzoyl-glutamate transporter AbgT